MDLMQELKALFGLLSVSDKEICRGNDFPLGIELDRSLRGKDFLRASTKSVRMTFAADFELFARQSKTFKLCIHPHEIVPPMKAVYQGLGFLPSKDWLSESRVYKAFDSDFYCMLINREYFTFYQAIAGRNFKLQSSHEALMSQISDHFGFAYDGEFGFINSNYLFPADLPYVVSLLLEEKNQGAGHRTGSLVDKQFLCPFGSQYELFIVRQYQKSDIFADGPKSFVHYPGAELEIGSELDKFLAYLYFARQIGLEETRDVFDGIGRAIVTGSSYYRGAMIRLFLANYLEYMVKESPGLEISEAQRSLMYRESMDDILYLTERGFHV